MRHRIERGYWAEGDRISSLGELESEFAVARLTIRQSIDLLCEEGLLRAQQGRGTFVLERPEGKRWLGLSNDLRSLVASVLDGMFKLISINEFAQPPRLMQGEGEAAGSYVFLKSVQSDGDKRLSVVRLHLARHVFDRDPQYFKTAAALPRLVEMDGVSILRAHQTTLIGVAEPETAELLGVGLGEPIADCRLIVVDAGGRAIYVGEIQYHKDCFAMRVDLLVV